MKELKWVWFDHRTDLPTWITSRIGQIIVEWSVFGKGTRRVDSNAREHRHWVYTRLGRPPPMRRRSQVLKQ
jgi:hypothetical protein